MSHLPIPTSPSRDPAARCIESLRLIDDAAFRIAMLAQQAKIAHARNFDVGLPRIDNLVKAAEEVVRELKRHVDDAQMAVDDGYAAHEALAEDLGGAMGDVIRGIVFGGAR